VVVAEVPDRPGGLVEMLELLDGSGINIEYVYTFSFGAAERALMVFRFDDPDRAIALLQKFEINVLEAATICKSIAA
jgi:hypothetical protein